MENLCKTSGRNESGAGKQILLGIGILIACVLLAAGYFLFARPALLKLRYKLEYEDVILHQAEESNLDPALVVSVIFCESGYDKNAKSPVGARGLMQLMPATAQEVAGWLELAGYSESMLTDPEVNIRLGCRYLAYLIEEMGSVRAAVCAYNAGPGKTRSWIREYGEDKEGGPLYIPYPETEKYVKKVLSTCRVYRNLYPELTAAPTAE